VHVDPLSELEVLVLLRHCGKSIGEDEIIGSCVFPLSALEDQSQHTYHLYLTQPAHLLPLVGKMSADCHCKATFRLTYSSLRRLQSQRAMLAKEAEQISAAAPTAMASAT
jgi:hypothetical protein